MKNYTIILFLALLLSLLFSCLKEEDVTASEENMKHVDNYLYYLKSNKPVLVIGKTGGGFLFSNSTGLNGRIYEKGYYVGGNILQEETPNVFYQESLHFFIDSTQLHPGRIALDSNRVTYVVTNANLLQNNALIPKSDNNWLDIIAIDTTCGIIDAAFSFDAILYGQTITVRKGVLRANFCR